MKNLNPIKVIVNGNYSNIENRKEYVFKENYNEFHHVYCIKGKRTKTVIPNDSLFQTSKSLEVYKNLFLGTTSQIENGFIPSHSITNYHKSKIYKKREFAEDFLKQQYFENLRKICFGYLAQQEFFYSINYIEHLNTLSIANLLSKSWGDRGNTKMYLKIAKKYKKANVFKYQNQYGYVSQTENVY